MTDSLNIRPATAADAALIVHFVEALAAYEKLSHEAKATEADIARDLFGAEPKVFCEIAEWEGKPVGFTLWFYTYSTFQGRHGIWLEDLFVDPACRGLGAGRALIEGVYRTADEQGAERVYWLTENTNERAQHLYRQVAELTPFVQFRRERPDR